MKKKLAFALAVVFVLSMAVPAFASDMTLNTTYKMDGTIDLEKQVGHLCNTGAQMNQTISGEGEMEKTMNTTQIAGRVTVDDSQDFVTAEDAVENLSVTSSIRLCAPAKHELSAEERTYLDEFHQDHIPADAWQTTWADTMVPDALRGYWNLGWDSWEGVDLRDQLMDAAPTATWRAAIAATPDGQLEDLIATHYNAAPWLEQFLVYTTWDYTALTTQTWAAYVEAEPGEMGTLTQDFEAAYGWYDEQPVTETFGGRPDQWGFVGDPDYGWAIATGDDYVGNYFNIDQLAYVSDGEVRRFIDISSPFSHAFVHEDMSVVGMAEIEDVFAMDNIEPGEEAVPDWWDLF